MNKPVAWMFEYGTDRGDAVNGISWYPNVHFKKPDLGGLIRNIEPLYTHPVKELTELDYAEFLPIWKDFIKDAGSVLNMQMVAHHFYNLALRKAQEK